MIKSSNNGMFTIPAAPSAGTSVAQSGSANTYGSYVQMIASTAEADYIVGLRFAINAALGTTPTYLSVAIGTGGAGSETLIGTVDCPFYNANVGSVTGAGTPTIGGRVDLPFPIPVAASTRIACKTASDQAAVNGWKITLECYKQSDLIDAGVKEQADVQTWLTSTPNALLSGRVDANVGVNSDKTGYSLSVSPPTAAAIATSVWQDLLASSDFSTAASIGALLKADVNAPIGSIPTNPYTGTPPTAAAIATAVWQDATASDFTTASSIGKSLYTGIAPGQDGGLGIFGASQTLNLKQLDIENSSGHAVIMKSTDANSAGLYVESTTGFWGMRVVADAGIGLSAAGNVGAAFAGSPSYSGTKADIYCSGVGYIVGDLTGKILGNAVSFQPIAGIGVKVDSAAIATGVWQDATASDFTAASSIGKSLYTGNHAPGTVSGLPINDASGAVPADVQFINGNEASGDPSGFLDVHVFAIEPSVVTSIQSGLATSSALSGVATNAATAATQATTAATQTTAAAIAAAVWNALTASYQAVGSFGKWVLGLVAPAVNVTITPLMAQISGGPSKDVQLTAYIGSALPGLVISVLDNAGKPVTLSGTVKLLVYDPANESTPLFTVTGSYTGNQATFNIPDSDDVGIATAAASYRWAMWEMGGTYGNVRLTGGDYVLLDSGPIPN